MADNITGRDFSNASVTLATKEIAAGIHAGKFVLIDPTTPANNQAVSATGAAKVDGSSVTQPISATALPLPAGASTETTLAALNIKTPALGIAAPSASSPVTLPNDVVVGAAASIAAVNIDLLTGGASGWLDVSNYHAATILIVMGAGISAGAYFFEQTNDTAAAPNGVPWAVEETTVLTPTPNIAAINAVASTSRMFGGPIQCKFVRARASTAFVGGTIQAVGVFSQLPYMRMVQTIHQATAANLNFTLAGGGLGASANLIGDVGVQYRASATGGATVAKILSAASTNATSVKATSGRVVGYHLTNTTAAIKYFRLYNLAVAPTVGTSAPLSVIPISANSSAIVSIPGGIAFATGISYAITGAAADLDATAVAANDVVGSIFYA
jgi:hypothetical protein